MESLGHMGSLVHVQKLNLWSIMRNDYFGALREVGSLWNHEKKECYGHHEKLNLWGTLTLAMLNKLRCHAHF